MTNNITTYLKYANLQMAAESLFGVGPTDRAGIVKGAESMTAAELAEGNKHSSKFTAVQAQQFIDDGWTVVEHKSNTSTGFSGTLFKYSGETDPARGLVKGEMVLSFRSTEFIDDAARDNQATNAMEIKPYGWAFGQIADMEQWYGHLQQTYGLGATNRFSVTGYSLGGHLATAFKLLHPSDVNQTYTFNGAGVGRTQNGVSLAATIKQFDAQRSATVDLGNLFTDPSVRSLYESLRSTLQGGGKPTDAQRAAIDAITPPSVTVIVANIPIKVKVPNRDPQAQMLIEAFNRVLTIQSEMARVGTLHSGSTDPSAPTSPVTPDASAVEATDINYQIAVLTAAKNTSAVNPIQTAVQAVAGRQQQAPLPNFYDIYGDTSPSAVSNSQLHYGAETPVFIEDQPLLRGSVVVDAAQQTYAYNDFKLLVEGYANNDFGDTHSLVLLVDSLSVQDALAKLDPKVEIGTLSAILKGASAAKVQTDLLGGQGKAEGDVLERVVDALYKMFVKPSADGTDTTTQMKGGTWADITARNAFYKRLDDIVKSGAFQAAMTGGFAAIKASAIDLAGQARDDFGALASLLTLSPFSITAKNPADRDALSGALGKAWGSTYTDWQTDKNLSQAERGTGKETYTDRWINDRALLLSGIVVAGKENVTDSVVAGNLSFGQRLQTSYVSNGVTQQLLFQSSRGDTFLSPVSYLRFGGEANDFLVGCTLNDRLYGGGGLDQINAGDGNDYLEGGADFDSLYGEKGDDTLVGGTGDDWLAGGGDDDSLLGGAGTDTYDIAAGEGLDTIRDSDGKGIVHLGSATLNGGKQISAGYYQNADKSVSYTVTGDIASATGASVLVSSASAEVRIEGFHDGDLGITLGAGTAAPVVPVQTSADDYLDDIVGNGADGGVGNDVLISQDLAQQLDGGSGDDLLFGGAGDDTLDGGIGNDFLNGGSGHDLISGGAGNDLILGSYNYAGIGLTGAVSTDLWAKVAGSWRWDWDSGVPGDRLVYINGDDDVAAVWKVSASDTQFGMVRSSGDKSLADTVFAGAGDDFVSGTDGNDYVSGDGGDDGLFGGPGDDTVFGGEGNDEVVGNTGADYLDGGAGKDELDGGYGADTLFGGGGDDVLVGDLPDLWGTDAPPSTVNFSRMDSDYLDGEDGNDSLWGGGGNDTLYGGTGNDSLEGDGLGTPNANLGKDLLDGEDGDDTLKGGGSADTLYGGAGNDVLLGDGNDSNIELASDAGDSIDGGAGDDQLSGNGGDDTLYGSAGHDMLLGGSGNDLLDGGSGNDWIEGGTGDDTLRGGAGADTLQGGLGNDLYIIDADDVPEQGVRVETLAGGTMVMHTVAETLVDEGGVNTVQVSGAVSATQQGTDGSLRLVLGDAASARVLMLQDAFTGAIQNLVLDADQGGSTTVHEWVQTHVTQSMTLSAMSAGQTVFSGGGMDQLTATVAGATLDGGRGNDTLVLFNGGSAGGTALQFAAGDGQDSVIGSASADALASRQANVAKFADGVDPASLRLVAQRPDSLGGLTRVFLNYGGDGDRIEITFDGDLRSFDRFEFADGSSLSLDQVAARGILFDGSVGVGTFTGTSGNDIITGTTAEDGIFGGAGDDTLDGGAGNDQLYGGAGNNTYVFGLGSGRDTVNADAGSGTDTVRFQAGIGAADVMWSRIGDDLLIRLRGSDDRLTVRGAYATQQVQQFVFADGSTIALDALVLSTGADQASAAADVIYLGASGESVNALAGDDSVLGDTGDDTIDGGTGADTLVGGAGNDRLNGAEGNDSLIGGTGNDTYVFGKGDGQDRINSYDGNAGQLDAVEFDADIAPADVIASRNELDLVLSINGTTDQLMVTGYFQGDGGAGYQVEQLRFADGTIWDVEAVKAKVLAGADATQTLVGYGSNDAIAAGAGNDTLRGMGGNDTLDGGAGDDTLDGGSGNDTYLFGRGSGQDLLSGYDGAAAKTDTLMFSAGVAPSDIVVTRTDDDLLLAIASTSDAISIPGYFSSLRPVDVIRFADGTAWDVDTLKTQLLSGTAGADTISGYSGDDVIRGASGNDWLGGGTGSDVLYGETGNDTLHGDEGNDTLDGGAGNDTLFGDSGGDTVLFGFGDGLDEWIEQVNSVASDGTDRVRLKPGIAPADVTLTRVTGTRSDAEVRQMGPLQDSLVLSLGDGSELWLDNYFASTGQGLVESIEFDDGTAWQYADVLEKVGSAAEGTANTMTGTAGNDSYVVDHPVDNIVEAADGGTDSVESSVSYTLPANVENLQLTGLLSISGTGNAGDNVIVGNAGSNVLDNGGGGNDVLRGGAGDDVYRVVKVAATVADLSDLLGPMQTQVVEAAGQGIDELVTNAWSVTLPDNVENLTLEGLQDAYHVYAGRATAIELGYAGNVLDNRIDLSQPGRFPSFSFDNGTWLPMRTLIDGGTGADTMIGSVIDDTYVVDDAGDQVVETGFYALDHLETSVADRVVSGIDYTLGAHLEQLQLQGTAAISGTGNDLSNLLDGSTSSGANVLKGGKGDDIYRIGAGDIVDEQAGEGWDTVVLTVATVVPVAVSDWANVENLRADALAGAIALTGDDDANVLTGNSASNILRGMDGDDTLDDVYIADLAKDSMGRPVYPDDADELYGGNGNDTLSSNGGADLLDGGAGNDELSGHGNLYRVRFGAGYGQDTLTDTKSQRSEESSAAGPVLQRIELTDGTSGQGLRFRQSDTSLVISLEGSSDSLTVASFFEEGGSVMRSGIDTLVLADGTVLTREAIRAGLDDADRVTATAGSDLLIAANTGTDLAGGDGADYLVGGAGSDTLNGGTGADRLLGADGEDVLDGGAGDDVLVGGRGADSYLFAAGWGNDIVDDLQARGAAAMGVGVAMDDDGAVDEIAFDASVTLASLDFGLAGSGDLFITRRDSTDVIDVLGYLDNANGDIERIRFADGTVLGRADVIRLASVQHGSAGDDVMIALTSGSELHGEAGNDTLAGNAGNDVLDGGTGADAMSGGAGDDTFVVDNVLDTVSENVAEGLDTVQSSATFALAANVENLMLTGSAAINASGNALANVLTGNAAANTLDGAAGADTLVGGRGDDTYVVDNVGDIVIESADGDNDTVQSSMSWTLGDNLENLTLSGTLAVSGTGNALRNTIIGSAGANRLDGGADADILIGGAGNDSYVVDDAGDQIVEAVGGGIDTVEASASHTLEAEVEILTLTGDGAIDAIGNALANRLTGNAGSNVLDGGAGIDTLIGGAGDDVYRVDNSNDVVTEALEAGTDRVEASVSWALGYNLEDLLLTGTAAINATGNSLNNRLIGNSGANVLDGGKNADTLIGGAGDDIYIVDNAADVVTENANEGTDSVQAATSWTLGANLENLTLTRVGGADSATGNVLSNVLNGTSGANRIDGGAGADRMIGGVGNDTYVVDDAGDVIVEAVGEGTDTVESSIDYSLGANLENLTLTGTGALSASGNALANVLRGNAGNNVLDGREGADTMYGGAGDDVFRVDNAGDVINERVDEGTDRVEASISYTLGITVENLTLTGNAAINGTGNSIANVLVGNAAANQLSGAGGNDTYAGGLGADVLTDTSTTSADTYQWGRDQGQDVVTDSGGNDRLQVLAGVTADQLWLQHLGNDLDVKVIGTGDDILIKNWYGSTSNRIETFVLSDGKTLLAADVQKLVNAMASFSPPADGQTTLPTNYQGSLLPVIASNWH